MKLKLEHLEPYLYYGLTFKGKRKGYFSFDKEIMTFCSLDLDGRWQEFKPILRPLSEITKEINQNGKTINIDLISFKLLGGRFLSEVLKEGKLIDELPHGLVSILYEYHFDVFGLIEKKIAIDKNTPIII